jgi:hypothetical protein
LSAADAGLRWEAQKLREAPMQAAARPDACVHPNERGTMNALELVGKKVHYKGQVGWVTNGHAGATPAVDVKLQRPIGLSPQFVRVWECDWDELEILDG